MAQLTSKDVVNVEMLPWYLMSQYDKDTMIHNDGNDHIIDKLISLYHTREVPMYGSGATTPP